MQQLTLAGKLTLAVLILGLLYAGFHYLGPKKTPAPLAAAPDSTRTTLSDTVILLDNTRLKKTSTEPTLAVSVPNPKPAAAAPAAQPHKRLKTKEKPVYVRRHRRKAEADTDEQAVNTTIPNF